MLLVLSIINYVLLFAILVSAVGIFYSTIKQKAMKRWIKILAVCFVASVICILIDADIALLIAFIGFYSFIFSVLSFILVIYFTTKRSLDKHNIWIWIFIAFLVLFIASFALNGVIFRWWKNKSSMINSSFIFYHRTFYFMRYAIYLNQSINKHSLERALRQLLLRNQQY